MAADPPLSTLLSQTLVAFTVEFDNEAERRMEHRTTWGPAAASRRGPWLVSQVMWANFMRFVADRGVTLGALDGPARMTNLAGLERWGYIAIDPGQASGRPRPRRDWVVRTTPAGRRAQEVWRPLATEIEARWRARFGGDDIDRLRRSLQSLRGGLEIALPRYLPVVNYSDGMRCVLPLDLGPVADEDRPARDPDLSELIAQVLLAFTLGYERESKLSMAMCADVLRVLGATGVLVRDLPRLTGVSEEAISAALGFLGRHGYAAMEDGPPGRRAKSVHLSARGLQARESYRRLVGAVEARWAARFGAPEISRLRERLEGLFAQRDGDRPRVAQGLVPDPGGWRAHRPWVTQTEAMLHDPRGALPHHPMVLHRGGWPDGS